MKEGDYMETTIYLIRHGETLWNRERRIQGHQDVPLSETGLEQARRLGKYLRGIHFHGMYASDLQRAVQTAEEVIAGRNLSVHTFPSLRERYLGEWEGLSFESLKKQYPEDWQTVWNRGGKYGVEPTEEIRARMMAALGGICREHPGQRVAVVSHGRSINTVLEAVSDGRYGPGRNRIGNTAVSILVYHPESRWRVEEVNRGEHLESEEAKG
jgi:broad specificity phosphatase PhoE